MAWTIKESLPSEHNLLKHTHYARCKGKTQFRSACSALLRLHLKHTHYYRISNTETRGHCGGTGHRETHNTNMVSIPINDRLDLESQLVSLSCFFHRVRQQPPASRLSENLLRCARGRLNSNYVHNKESRCDCYIHATANSTGLVSLTRHSSGDTTTSFTQQQTSRYTCS